MISLSRGVRDSGLVAGSESELSVEGAVGRDSVGVSAWGGEIVEKLGLLAAIPAEELEM